MGMAKGASSIPGAGSLMGMAKGASSIPGAGKLLGMGGGSRRKSAKRRNVTSKKPKYGSRCKTLFYKNGGRRRKTRHLTK